MIVGLYQRHHY